MTISDLVAEDLPVEMRNDRRLYSSCLSGAISERDYVRGLLDAGLESVSVIDRIIYDASQLEALVSSESGCSCCCSGDPGGVVPAGWMDLLAGRVASIRVRAVKPSR
jgi:hypothetical protein